MPVYERSPGVFRVVVWSGGKPHEKVVHGPRAVAEGQEAWLREKVGGKRKDSELGVEQDRADVIWIGGHDGSYVYFLRAGAGGAIKIGHTRNTTIRLGAVQLGNPERLHLLCAIPGGRLLERTMHTAFKNLRLEGEWFTPHASLLALIGELNSTVRNGNPGVSLAGAV